MELLQAIHAKLAGAKVFHVSAPTLQAAMELLLDDDEYMDFILELEAALEKVIACMQAAEQQEARELIRKVARLSAGYDLVHEPGCAMAM